MVAQRLGIVSQQVVSGTKKMNFTYSISRAVSVKKFGGGSLK